MDKNRISNHSWICRTITGTIALEEIPMPLKQRNFLKQISKPARVSELYKMLKEKYPNDYSKTSDFVEIVDFTSKKIWIEKVEQPQIVTIDTKAETEENSLDDSKDSISVPEDILNLSKKAQSGYSEESEIFAVEFEEKKVKQEEIQKWLEKEAEYEEQVVEFVPDQKTQELILRLGLGSLQNFDDLELPEEDPFAYKEKNVPKTEAAVQILNILDKFKDYDETDETDEIDEIVTNIESIKENKNYDNERKEIVIPKIEISPIEERENKRIERLNKRKAVNDVVQKDNKKNEGLLINLKNRLKKILGQ